MCVLSGDADVRPRTGSLPAAITSLVLLFAMGQSALAAADISTQGCADTDVSCTLQELLDGGSIQVNNVLFSNFADVGPQSFGGSQIEVTPFGSPFSDVSAGFFIEPIDLANNPWSISGFEDMSYSAGIEYDVTVLIGEPIGATTLFTRFGQLIASGTGFIDGVALMQIEVPGLGLLVQLDVSCNELDSLDCTGLAGSEDQSLGQIFSFRVLQAIDLDFTIVAPGGGAIEMTRIANDFRRVPSDARRIISSGLWRSSDTFVPGWEQGECDDDPWVEARAPYPSSISPTDLIADTPAQFIWHDPAQTSDGTTGVIEAFLRTCFDLDLVATNAPLSALAQVSVDDDYDLYVNGTLVFENHDNGFAGQVDTIDIAPYLRHGSNVVAIQAVDGGWGLPRPRGGERVLFDALITPAPYVRIPILSNGDWLSSDTLEDNWNTLIFNDDDWAPARASYPGTAASTLIPDTSAMSIWHDPDAVYDGTDGPVQAYFRYSFDIPTDPEALPVVAQMRVSVDDDYSLWVNGVLVYENHDNGFADVVDFIDFTYALREGPNVIAIHAVDGGWDNPRPRGFERLTVDGLVASGVLDWQFVPILGPGAYSLSGPVLDGDFLAFSGGDEFWFEYFPQLVDLPGVWRLDLANQTSELVATDGTPRPDAGGTLVDYFAVAPSLDDGDIAFNAGFASPVAPFSGTGVYLNSDGLLQTVADTDTDIPGGTGKFESFSRTSLSNARVAFIGRGAGGQRGIYIADAGGLSVVADLDTPAPGSGGNFTGFGDWVAMDDDSSGLLEIAFLGRSAINSGIYLSTPAGIQIVADESTAIPDGGGQTFDTFNCAPDYADATVSFSNGGIYKWADGMLQTVNADSGDCAPPTSATRTAFADMRTLYTDIGLTVTPIFTGSNPLADLLIGEPHVIDSIIHSAGSLSRNRVALRTEVVRPVTGRGEFRIDFTLVADDQFGFVADVDGDGIVDAADNCIEHANSAQSDTDEDGYGNVCDPDLNDDGAVNFLDLQIIKDLFFGADEDADLNQDGTVNFGDLAIVKAFFFGTPGPSALVH